MFIFLFRICFFEQASFLFASKSGKIEQIDTEVEMNNEMTKYQ